MYIWIDKPVFKILRYHLDRPSHHGASLQLSQDHLQTRQNQVTHHPFHLPFHQKYHCLVKGIAALLSWDPSRPVHSLPNQLRQPQPNARELQQLLLTPLEQLCQLTLHQVVMGLHTAELSQLVMRS